MDFLFCFCLNLLSCLNKGFSVGDELGLAESLNNLEVDKRRSVSQFEGALAANSIGTIPASKLPVKN